MGSKLGMTPTERAINQLPDHLRAYVVKQNYDQYTPRDHAVWRHILTRLRKELKHSAHPDYIEGLSRTGISINRIPSLDEMNMCLEDIGWTAVAVRGFIPPAVFTELQSRSVLAIAEDIRDHRHIGYTPAPDIVHESAGHSPILINKKYARYVQKCGSLGFKAIASREDFAVFEAIRNLSIIKENPNSSEYQIREAETKLISASTSHRYISENTKASRLYWWTAEYGLVGSLNDPKLFGAGLLSSIQEAEHARTNKVKKVSLSLECIEKAYDITTMQPQLFVARDFDHLFEVLEEFEATLSFTRGGVYALSEAKRAETIVHIELDGDRSLSGQVVDFVHTTTNTLIYLKGPSLIEYNSKEYKFDHGPTLLLWQHIPSTVSGTINLSLDQNYLAGFLKDDVLTDIKTDHPILKEIIQGTSAQFISSLTLNSIGGGPKNPTLWEKLVPTKSSFIYEEGELKVRDAKIKDLDPKLSRIYNDLNQMIFKGKIDRQKLEALTIDASEFPSEWLLHSQIDDYKSFGEIA